MVLVEKDKGVATFRVSEIGLAAVQFEFGIAVEQPLDDDPVPIL